MCGTHESGTHERGTHESVVRMGAHFNEHNLVRVLRNEPMDGLGQEDNSLWPKGTQADLIEHCRDISHGRTPQTRSQGAADRTT